MVVQLSLHLVLSSSRAAHCVPTPWSWSWSCSCCRCCWALTHGPCPQLCQAPSTSVLALTPSIWPTVFLFDCGWTALWWICCRKTIPQLRPQQNNSPDSSHSPALYTHTSRGRVPSRRKKNDNQDRECPDSGNLAKDVRCQTNTSKCYCTMKVPPKCLHILVHCGLKCENMTLPFLQ